VFVGQYVKFIYLLRITLDFLPNLTISISDEIIRKLRKTVQDRYGGKKGAISGIIEESLREKLYSLESTQEHQYFRALKSDKVVAESENLATLSSQLDKAKINPRSVRIISSKRIAPLVRTGPRGRGRSS
jgi:hypothetical protein